MIEIRNADFDPYQLLSTYTAQLDLSQSGGSCHFIGHMRNFNEGETVLSMTLEHYPGMTEKALAQLEQQARSQWPINDVYIVHRVGEIQVGQAIVLVAVWSAHRAEAFEACRFLIDTLKTKAPFWKKEQLESGTRWVEKNT